MPRSKTTNDKQDENTKKSRDINKMQVGENKRKHLIMYIAIAAVVIVAVAAVYIFISGSKTLNSNQIFSSISNASLNQTQKQFVDDLEKSGNITNIAVVYKVLNSTAYVTESNNLTLAINSNDTISSYKMGNYNKTVIASIVTDSNAKTGEIIAKNASYVYYYNTNTTLTCFNETIYSASVSNSSLDCGSGDQGLDYIEEAPFTAANVSSLSYLALNNTVTYQGIRSIAGRNCDNFIISNETGSNLESNYTVFDMCVDRQYGILLYINETEVSNGLPSSFVMTAVSVSPYVNASEFVIPQRYLNAKSSSII